MLGSSFVPMWKYACRTVEIVESFLRITANDDIERMEGESVHLSLTIGEIHELFARVLKSPEQDNPVSDAALQKLARALDRHQPRAASAA